MADQTNNFYKVQLHSAVHRDDKVIFEVSPELNESVSVKMESISPMHMPGSIYVYGSTSSRRFSLSAKFISRTTEEATRHMQYLWLLRSWTMPYFGESGYYLNRKQQRARITMPRTGSTLGNKTHQVLSPELQKEMYGNLISGSPPDVLKLYAYSDSSKSTHSHSMTNLHAVPVIIESLNIPYTSEVDYIPTDPTDNGIPSVPFPTSMLVEISLQETHAPKEFSKFKLEDFKKGKLDGF